MKYLTCPIGQNSRSKNRNAPAIIEETVITSYRKLEEYIDAAQKYLMISGISKKSRAAVLCRTNLEFIIIYFALLRIGSTNCLLSTRMNRAVFLKQCRNLKCRYIITTQQEIKTAQTFNVISFDRKNLIKYVNDVLPKSKPFRYDLTSISDIMLTSGSTDIPKAVVHTLGNHYFSALGSNQHIKVTRGSRWMLVLPTYHVSGLSILWRAFMAGAAVSVINDHRSLGAKIARNQPTHISLVYTQINRLLKYPTSVKNLQKMKAILVGGSAVIEPVIEKSVKYRLPLYTSYGLTEISSQVATSKKISKTADSRKAHILAYRDVRVDARKQIYVKGKTLFKGYYVNGRIKRPFDRYGWFNTGDLGRLINKGQLQVFGRSDNLFISGGENIYPEEIERAVNRMAQVECSVVVPIKDKVYGQVPVCFVKPKQGRKITLRILDVHISKYLDRFKKPHKYYTWPDDLRVDGIKINRRAFARYLTKKKSNLLKLS